MKVTISFFFIFLFFHCFTRLQAQQKWPTEIDNSLSAAHTNRQELEKVLHHYAEQPTDSLKLEAAFYLISNMRWHNTAQKNIYNDQALFRIINVADSLYYNLIKNKTLTNLNTIDQGDEFGNVVRQVQQFRETVDISENIKKLENVNDAEIYNSDFLIDHIDNAFRLKQSSPLVSKLTFNEFCQIILPYNIITGKNISKPGSFFNQFFSKYLGEITGGRIEINASVQRYNLIISHFRKILGSYPLSEKVGFEELLFHIPFSAGWDCFDATNFCALILNACGIPVTAEYNASYKMTAGRHSNIAFSEKYGLSIFSPETNAPLFINTKAYYKEKMNFYQYCFEPQLNSPYFLKAGEEYVPDGLLNPLIKDVSILRNDTVTLTFPFAINTPNKLAYLATFNRTDGLICNSWGMIDKAAKRVVFENAIPNSLYFPVYFKGNQRIAFTEPFFLKTDSINGKAAYSKTGINLYKNKVLDSVFITRKFPVKRSMQELAKALAGTAILGSETEGFTNADTLYVFNYSPPPYPQDIALNTKKPYRYYRFVSPPAYRHITLAEIEFLTHKKYGYTDVATPSTLYTFNFRDMKKPIDNNLVKITDGINTRLPQYDGSVETAPRNESEITQGFSQPIHVTHIRFTPLNANNGIVPGNRYILYEWQNDTWKQIENIREATEQFLFYPKLKTNTLYWLKNISAGREEVPFLLDETGRQQFFYSDITFGSERVM